MKTKAKRKEEAPARPSVTVSSELLPAVLLADREQLRSGRHPEPHRVLGAHPASVDGADGVVVRAFHPDAARVELLPRDGDPVTMQATGDGIFALFFPGARLPLRYSLRFHFADGGVWERGDCYRFLPTIGEMDQHLFNEGKHHRLWRALGSHVREIDGERGVAFAVWAPSAQRVSVVGEFCAWDGRLFPMRAMGRSGIFELFIPGLGEGTLYKFEILTSDGYLRLKTDPFARAMQHPPETASRVTHSTYLWEDSGWLRARAEGDPLRRPMAIYELHLGSWRRVPEEGDRPLSYRESAGYLIEHCKRLGFTHIELLPIMEHPFDGSWGYQVSGYYAPTARFGEPDDLRYLVDQCHQNGIGVLLDWVPGHFPKDDWALRRFDGSALFEHDDPRLGEHPDWGTLIFNYGRHEVRNFLVANALYWLDEFHIDGLRVDAVASMLYLDYSRRPGEWLPNVHGGRENLEAVEFLKAVNEAVQIEHPGCMMIAEESTSWPGVSQPIDSGGLGFTLKWNMGWMHDTLQYFARDPVHRRHHQDELTFAMVYEHSEHFVMPLSHDEVVHGKSSLLNKLPGDPWQKLANLRLLLTYMYTRPGKKLLFMGTELGQEREWNYQQSLDWHLANEPARQGLLAFFEALGELYRATPAFWRRDPDPDGFAWVDCNDRDQSVLSYMRSDGETHRLVVLNLTPVPRPDYRIGVPEAGEYHVCFNSDDTRFGGSDVEVSPLLPTEPSPFHGLPYSLRATLPPLAALVLSP